MRSRRIMKPKGDYKKYAATLKELMAVKDSVFKINSSDVSGEMQIRYELQRNENTIIRQKLSLIEKNYWLNAYVLFLIMAVAGGYFHVQGIQEKE